SAHSLRTQTIWAAARGRRPSATTATCLPESRGITGAMRVRQMRVMQNTHLTVLTLTMLIAGGGLCLAEEPRTADGIGSWRTTVSAAAPSVDSPGPSSRRDPGRSARSQTGSASEHALEGIASYYWQGQKTASGEPFDKKALT